MTSSKNNNWLKVGPLQNSEFSCSYMYNRSITENDKRLWLSITKDSNDWSIWPALITEELKSSNYNLYRVDCILQPNKLGLTSGTFENWFLKSVGLRLDSSIRMKFFFSSKIPFLIATKHFFLIFSKTTKWVWISPSKKLPVWSTLLSRWSCLSGW